MIHGGWAMWIITFCSIVALAVTMERIQAFRRANVDSEELLDRVSAQLETGNIDSAIDVCTQTPGPVAETLKTGLRKLVFLERLGKKPEEIEEGIVAAMQEHGGHVVEWLERNLTTLATVASMAPMLGMLGTVVGMINAFGEVGRMGNLTPEAVSKGISEALICTASGLFVAAVATVEYNYFTTRVNRFTLKVQAAGTVLVERVLDMHIAQRGSGASRQSAASTVAPQVMGASPVSGSGTLPASAAPVSRPAAGVAPVTTSPAASARPAALTERSGTSARPASLSTERSVPAERGASVAGKPVAPRPASAPINVAPKAQPET